MERLLLALALVAVALAVAWVLQRRQRVDAPTSGGRPAARVPAQLDRADFAGPATPWLVAVFTSETCASCADALAKAEVLRSEEVVVDAVSWQARRDLHERYAIDTVPLTLVADPRGVVRASFVGRASATDLWAAVAEARAPGASPEPGLGQPPG